MISEFFKDREPREKLLLAIAAVVTFVLALWQFGWTPSKSYRDNAARAYRTAMTDYHVVEGVSRKVKAKRNPSTASTPLQSVVVDVANIYGLTISRIEPDANNGLTLWFEGVNPNTLFAWLKDLDDNHGIVVDKASVRRLQDAEEVSANLHVQRSL